VFLFVYRPSRANHQSPSAMVVAMIKKSMSFMLSP